MNAIGCIHRVSRREARAGPYPASSAGCVFDHRAHVERALVPRSDEHDHFVDFIRSYSGQLYPPFERRSRMIKEIQSLGG